MRLIPLFKRTTMFILFSGWPILSLAAGGSAGGGGSQSLEKAAYEAAMETYIKNMLPNEVVKAFSQIQVDKISSIELKKVMSEMSKNNSLINDINEMGSKQYEFKLECPDSKDEYALGQRKTPICFSKKNLLERIPKVGASDLILLALHGHAHQFGWKMSSAEELNHAHTLAEVFSPEIISNQKAISLANLKIKPGRYNVPNTVMCDRQIEVDEDLEVIYIEFLPRKNDQYKPSQRCSTHIVFVANCSFPTAEATCIGQWYDLKDDNNEIAGIYLQRPDDFGTLWVQEFFKVSSAGSLFLRTNIFPVHYDGTPAATNYSRLRKLTFIKE